MESLSLGEEACPRCKSELTEIVRIEGEKWWVCNFTGCDGRVSSAKFFFRPGQGLPPKEDKSAKKAEEDAEEATVDTEG